MGNTCTNICEPPIDEGFIKEMQEIIGELIGPIIIGYPVEKRHIVEEMRRASPNPYRNLLYVDYPERNRAQVNDLARRNLTSDAVKEQIAEQVNERLQTRIEGLTANMNPCVRTLQSSAIEKLIEAAVGRALDAIVFPDDDIICDRTMPERQLGRNGPKVSAIGFGAMNLSLKDNRTAVSDEERFKILDRAIELGSTYFDSADMQGDNEDLLGKYFKKYPHQRQKVFLATKFTAPDNKSFSVSEACEKSLKRLGLESIDLYYLQYIDKIVPIEQTMNAVKELVTAGKIKQIGLCACSSNTLRRAYAVHPVVCVQIEYSPFCLDAERPEIGLIETCKDLSVAMICCSPMGRGILSGEIQSPNDFKANDLRRLLPRFSKENFPKNLQLVKELKSIAEKKNCTSSQLILAWILAQGSDFIPVPGTCNLKHLEENAAAAQIKLNEEDVREIREACSRADMAHERYPDSLLINLYADTASTKN